MVSSTMCPRSFSTLSSVGTTGGSPADARWDPCGEIISMCLTKGRIRDLSPNPIRFPNDGGDSRVWMLVAMNPGTRGESVDDEMVVDERSTPGMPHSTARSAPTMENVS